MTLNGKIVNSDSSMCKALHGVLCNFPDDCWLRLWGLAWPSGLSDGHELLASTSLIPLLIMNQTTVFSWIRCVNCYGFAYYISEGATEKEKGALKKMRFQGLLLLCSISALVGARQKEGMTVVITWLLQ